MWAQKTFKTDLFKGVTKAKFRHLGLREVKLKEDTFFPQVKDNFFKTKHIAKVQHLYLVNNNWQQNKFKRCNILPKPVPDTV